MNTMRSQSLHHYEMLASTCSMARDGADNRWHSTPVIREINRVYCRLY